MMERLLILILLATGVICQESTRSPNVTLGVTTQPSGAIAAPVPGSPQAARQIAGKISLDVPLKNVKKYRGENLRLVCEITGNPLPTYSWYYNGEGLVNGKKYTIRDVPWGSKLRISNVQPRDSGIYKCIAFNRFGSKETNATVIVRNEYRPRSGTSTPETDIVEPDITYNVPGRYKPPGTNGGDIGNPYSSGEPYCQPYRGGACHKYLSGKNIYVTSKIMQGEVEKKLIDAMNLINTLANPSKRCIKYAIPALCHYTFPECKGSNSNPQPRQICRDECQALENDICKREYTILTSSPQAFGLPKCRELPASNSPQAADCLSLNLLSRPPVLVSSPPERSTTPSLTYTIANNNQPGITRMQIDIDCYSGTGKSYKGTVSTAKSGRPCTPWNSQYDGGSHNYCRNFGSKDKAPWCYVGSMKEMCAIPKCGNNPTESSPKSTKSNEKGSSNLLIIVIPSVAVPLAIATLLLVVCLCHRNRKNKKGNNNRKVVKNGKNVEMSSLLVSNPTKVKEFPISSVRFLQQLGEGDFGRVYQGDLVGLYAENSVTRVAIKTLREKSTPKLKNDFRRDVDRMSDLKHPNILCLAGVCMKEDPWCMLFECMMHGDLHQFLTMHSPMSDMSVNSDDGGEHHLGYRDMLHVSIQISAGLEYLSSRHYVHKDIACRNILVGDNITCKISDLGLSKDLYPGDYYMLQNQTLIPLRWMSPESIIYGKYAVETDIWSYAVALWEIYSHGLQPYYGYNNQDVMDMIRARQILPCPDECPSRVYSLMVECWQENASRRPSFREIHTRLIGWMGETMGQVPHMSGSASGRSSSHHSSHHSSTGPSNNTATTLMTPSTNHSQSPVPMMVGHMSSGGVYGTPVHCSSPPPYPMVQGQHHQNIFMQQPGPGRNTVPHAAYVQPQQGFNITTPGYSNMGVIHHSSPPASTHSHKTSQSSSRSSSLANVRNNGNRKQRHSDKVVSSPEIEELKQSDI